jgi:dinuclear metal center YbgI/SA1388 family protein
LSGIVEIANRLFPFDMAEKWDNCGIQIGNPGATITSIAFSLDPTPETVRFAENHSCQLLITHHPVFLEPFRNVTTESLAGKTVMEAARTGVSVLSLHTNLDAAPGGLNDLLAAKLGLHSVYTPLPARCARMGSLAEPAGVFQLTRRWAEDLGIPHARVVAREDKQVHTVFCASGSGMSYLRDALQHGADLMVTGDVRYHAAREALELGMPVIDAGHFGLEKVAVPLLLNAFRNEFQKMNVSVNLFVCDTESEPFADIYHP